MEIGDRVVCIEENSFFDGVRACLPTVLGYLSIGFAAGVVEKTDGLSVVEIALMSLLIYAGSAQFIVAGLIAAKGTAMAIIFMIFLVNIRHLLFSAALSPYFRRLTPLRNLLIGSLLTDETFGVAINQSLNEHSISEKWMHGLNVTAYLNWGIANIVGAIVGQRISNPGRFGLDFALPAMFIGLLVLQMVSRNTMVRDVLVVIVAVVIVVGVSLVTSASIAVIAATLIASTIGMVVEKWK